MPDQRRKPGGRAAGPVASARRLRFLDPLPLGDRPMPPGGAGIGTVLRGARPPLHQAGGARISDVIGRPPSDPFHATSARAAALGAPLLVWGLELSALMAPARAILALTRLPPPPPLASHTTG